MKYRIQNVHADFHQSVSIIFFAVVFATCLTAPSFLYHNICRFMPCGISTEIKQYEFLSEMIAAIAAANGYVKIF